MAGRTSKADNGGRTRQRIQQSARWRTAKTPPRACPGAGRPYRRADPRRFAHAWLDDRCDAQPHKGHQIHPGTRSAHVWRSCCGSAAVSARRSHWCAPICARIKLAVGAVPAACIAPTLPHLPLPLLTVLACPPCAYNQGRKGCSYAKPHELTANFTLLHFGQEHSRPYEPVLDWSCADPHHGRKLRLRKEELCSQSS